VKELVTSLGCGLLFGIGLCISGMSVPANVIAFLDVSGRWSPNLAGVMFGAIAVHATWLHWPRRAGRRSTAVNADAPRSNLKRVDGALVAGAALFGIGWGMSGYCPGPAIVALGSGALGTLVFVAAMALGMVLSEGSHWTIKRSGKPSAVPH